MQRGAQRKKNDSAKMSDQGRRITYAEALLLETVEGASPREGRVLVAGNRSGVVVGEAMRRWPAAEVTAHAFDAHHARAIRKHLLAEGLPARGVVCTPEVGEGYGTALFMTTPQSMTAELVLDQLQDIFLSMDEGGELWAAFEGDQDAAIKTMKQVWPAVHVEKRAKHAILLRAEKRGQIVKTRDFSAEWQASVPGGEPVTFTSLPGCFCHRRPDTGGLALAEVAAREKGCARIIDMGCGCGLVGLLVADAFRRAGESPALTLVDSHARAIAAARINAARLGFEPEFILADDGLPRGRVGEFDLFVGNPPYYSDSRIADVFLETAYRALRPGGICLSVVKTASGLIPVQEKFFRKVEVIPRRGYSVLRSVR